MDGLVDGWHARLRELIGRMGHLFARPEPWEVFGELVEGLLSNLEKKNCWTLAQRAGHTHPGRMQSFLCRGAWSADALEAEVRDLPAPRARSWSTGSRPPATSPTTRRDCCTWR